MVVAGGLPGMGPGRARGGVVAAAGRWRGNSVPAAVGVPGEPGGRWWLAVVLAVVAGWSGGGVGVHVN